MTSEQRSKNMAAIHSKGTKPEMLVRRWLLSRGFRYRLNSPRLPGKPDLVLRRYRTCIFVNGCFWHGHKVSLKAAIKREQNEVYFDFAKREQARDAVSTLNIENSECCKIPKTNREFWVAKIRRNQERDAMERMRLKEMGWHGITVWECELKPQVREQTLTALERTLHHIFLQDHAVTYDTMEEGLPMAAEAASAKSDFGFASPKERLRLKNNE